MSKRPGSMKIADILMERATLYIKRVRKVLLL